MPRKGENIYKRKDGRWEGRFIKSRDFSGKAIYGYVYGKTYTAVKEKLRCANDDTAGTHFSSVEKNCIFESVLKEWLESERIKTKESTYAHYYQIVYSHLIPKLGSVQIVSITALLIERYMRQILENGRLDGKGGLSPKTANDILVVIKAAVAYAKNCDYPIKCNLDKVLIKQKKRDIRVLSLDEQKKVTSVLLDKTDSVKFGILLSLYTGIRIGELCALKWDDINVERGVLSIRRTMQRIKDTSNHHDKQTKIIITEPKSSSSIRDIPMPPFILSVAKELRSGGNSYILSSDKNHFIEPRALQYRFCALIQESQIEKVNFHVLRHPYVKRKTKKFANPFGTGSEHFSQHPVLSLGTA